MPEAGQSAHLRGAPDRARGHLNVIHERLGHASTKTTLDTRRHLLDDLNEPAAGLLGQRWR